MPDLVQVTSPSGVRFTVAKEAADAFSGLLADLEGSGYKIDPGNSGGYNPRNIAGTSTPSQHSFGLAIDINSNRNPRGAKTPTDLPANIADIAARHGLTWGGTWEGDTRDPMHFELGGTKVAEAAPSTDDLLSQARGIVPALTASSPASTSAPATDDLLSQARVVVPGPFAPPLAKPTTDAAIPTLRPVAAAGPATTLPSFIANDPAGAIPRILEAAKEGYYGAPDLLAPGAQQTVDSWGRIPAAVSRMPGTALGLASGLYRGAQQFGTEILGDVSPSLARDVVSMPDAFAGSPNLLQQPRSVPSWATPPMPTTMPRGPYSPPAPNLLVGGVEPVTSSVAAAAKASAGPTAAVPQLPAGAPTGGRAPATAAEAKAVANAHYATAPQTDSGLTPQFNAKLVDAISPARETESLVGKNDAVDLVEKLKARADQPLSIKGVQEQDEDMTQLIEQHRDPTTGRLDKVGQQIDEMQDKFREQIDNAGEGDTTGGPEGFAALQNGRAAWAQYRKMADVERMWEIAQTRKVPQTNFENRVGTYLNSKKATGWTAEEKAALTDASKNGITDNVLHLLGNKLIAAVTGAASGAKWGWPGVVIGEAVSQGLATGARGLETSRLGGRIGNALETLGGRVPSTPLLRTLPPVGAAGPPASTVPYWAAPLLASSQPPPVQRNWLNPGG